MLPNRFSSLYHTVLSLSIRYGSVGFFEMKKSKADFADAAEEKFVLEIAESPLISKADPHIMYITGKNI